VVHVQLSRSTDHAKIDVRALREAAIAMRSTVLIQLLDVLEASRKAVRKCRDWEQEDGRWDWDCPTEVDYLEDALAPFDFGDEKPAC
jgi:hypothetical protein